MEIDLNNLDPISIHLILKEHKQEDGKILESCLTHALWEARHITGRDQATGVILEPLPEGSYPGRWSGTMIYFSILDQIGECYQPTGAVPNSTNSIQKALELFTSLPPLERDAIYALRNAFFHDFSLYNRNNKYPNLQHVFNVDNHPTNPPVLLPATKWEGAMSNNNPENITYINLRALGDLVENIYLKLLYLHEKGQLELILPGGQSELLGRYIFSHF